MIRCASIEVKIVIGFDVSDGVEEALFDELFHLLAGVDGIVEGFVHFPRLQYV